ncbi:UDP-N-acetylglucosamine-1-phosphate transferase [Methanogenium sp. MK-MG]|uniref:UDP-N-acetylglucosamine-1-phosphate transferase n=1 Tax=Methanogenium sp. MK-MG TaxID=2599926 RepID=UPI0013EBF0AC|nr:UDP-N-acetylglucosamine-1-phosphate transferase [Methanogenium sp. MK-MG]KAF1073528.1 Phospho-N-acetylmuramoyl-pentapeptide-transferase [Methanogenium sp. MK-MG]
MTIVNLVSSLNLMISVFFIVPFICTIVVMPHIIRRLKESNIVVKDMYKADLPEIAVNGGLVILLVSLLSLSVISLFYCNYILPANYVIIMVVALFALFGILDDMINIGRPAKLILLYYCSYSLISCATATHVYVPFIGTVDLGIFYLQLILPLYVPVVANLVNMHSGFNGLAPGLSLMVLITLILKTMADAEIMDILFIVCLTGSLAAYWLFEKYPARIIWGNIGALSVGAAIGATIVVEGFIFSGFVMLIPHVVNFLLYVYWRLHPGQYPVAKFGKIREDGTLEVPNPLTLKWVLPYYFPMTERQGVNVMYALTGIFCLIGFMIPG